MSSKPVKLPQYSHVRHSSLDSLYPITSVVTQELFDDAISYKPEPGDIFVVTYPKCGTTWVLNSILTMRHGGKPLPGEGNLLDTVRFIEFIGKQKTEEGEERPRIIKTHLYYEMTPWSNDAKYIVVARNPKDCFTSFYHHTVGFEKIYHFSDGKFEDYFELAINGEVDFGDFFKCVPEWWEKSKMKSNILFLLFEDMKENAEKELLKIADFIGPDWGKKVRANDNELLKKVIEESSFEKMKKRKDLFPSTATFARPDHMPFVRKGTVGDWENIFTREQSIRVDQKMKEAGGKYPGFDRLWDKYSKYI